MADYQYSRAKCTQQKAPSWGVPGAGYPAGITKQNPTVSHGGQGMRGARESEFVSLLLPLLPGEVT